MKTASFAYANKSLGLAQNLNNQINDNIFGSGTKDIVFNESMVFTEHSDVKSTGYTGDIGYIFEFNNVTINEGVSVLGNNRGIPFFLKVNGTLTINGNLNMNGQGSRASMPELIRFSAGLRYHPSFFTERTSGWETISGVNVGYTSYKGITPFNTTTLRQSNTRARTWYDFYRYGLTGNYFDYTIAALGTGGCVKLNSTNTAVEQRGILAGGGDPLLLTAGSQVSGGGSGGLTVLTYESMINNGLGFSDGSNVYPLNIHCNGSEKSNNEYVFRAGGGMMVIAARNIVLGPNGSITNDAELGGDGFIGAMNRSHDKTELLFNKGYPTEGTGVFSGGPGICLGYRLGSIGFNKLYDGFVESSSAEFVNIYNFNSNQVTDLTTNTEVVLNNAVMQPDTTNSVGSPFDGDTESSHLYYNSFGGNPHGYSVNNLSGRDLVLTGDFTIKFWYKSGYIANQTQSPPSAWIISGSDSKLKVSFPQIQIVTDDYNGPFGVQASQTVVFPNRDTDRVINVNWVSYYGLDVPVFPEGWYHVQFCRKNGYLYGFVQGNLAVISSNPYFGDILVLKKDSSMLGAVPNGTWYHEYYLKDFSILTGKALNTEDFNVPDNYTTNQLIFPGKQKLLLHLDKNFVDSSAFANTFTSVSTQKFVSNSKFGSTSLEIGREGISAIEQSNFDFSTKDFTIDCWIQRSNPTFSSDTYILKSTNFDFGYKIRKIFGDNQAYVRLGSTEYTATLPNTGSWGTPVWEHLELGREGSNMYIFLNGNLISTLTGITYNIAMSNLQFFLSDSPSLVDELQVRIGECTHTATFTPPITPYSREV